MLATSPSPCRGVLRLEWKENILKTFWEDLTYSGAKTTGKARCFLSTKPKYSVFIWVFQTISNNPFLTRKFESINFSCICVSYYPVFFPVILIIHFSFTLFILASLPHYNILYTWPSTLAHFYFFRWNSEWLGYSRYAFVCAC